MTPNLGFKVTGYLQVEYFAGVARVFNCTKQGYRSLGTLPKTWKWGRRWNILALGPYNNYVTLFWSIVTPPLPVTNCHIQPTPCIIMSHPTTHHPPTTPQTQCKIHGKVVSPRYSCSSTVALQSTSQPLKNKVHSEAVIVVHSSKFHPDALQLSPPEYGHRGRCRRH